MQTIIILSQAWAERLPAFLEMGLQGPIYYLWGTDWEDAPASSVCMI